MKIVFLSNFYNHHQSYISKKFFELTEGNYRFIETTKIPEERKKLGYRNEKDKFVLYYEEAPEEAQKWIDDADVVITGSSHQKLLRSRIKNNKIIFKYAERPLKKGFEFWKYPVRWLKWHINTPNNKPIYMLCSSAYTAGDYAKFGMHKNKTYKWGYFPACRRYDDLNGLLMKKKVDEILWCGRLLDWKHPDDVLEVAAHLKRAGYTFHISIIGIGEMEEVLHRKILETDLQGYVSMLGAMTPENVRQYMEQAGIYLFTSDRKEGWGAVLNEAMNSGCAVIAADEIGATPYLLKDEVNGLIYKSCNVDELYEKIRFLLEYKEEQKRLGKAAYKTIVTEWNHDVAAERLIRLAECVVLGEQEFEIYTEGPCSRA